MSDIVTGIFDSNSRQVFQSAGIIKLTVKETAKLMEHPIETGGTIVDHKIILPVEADISMILDPADYRDVYLQIRQAFQNGTLFTVQTRTFRYSRMLFNAIPHEESPDMYDTIAIACTMREAKIFKTVYGTAPLGADQVKNQSDTSTVKSGQKQPKSAAAALLSSAQEGVRSFFSGG